MSTPVSPEVVRPARHEELYQELGRIAGVNVPERAVRGVLEQIGSWDYSATTIGVERIRHLHRPILDGTADLELPEAESRRRNVMTDERSVSIHAPTIQGADLRYVIDVENNIDAMRERRAMRVAAKRNEVNTIFSQASESRDGPDQLFSEKEAMAVSLLPSSVTVEKVGEILGVDDSSVVRLLQPARERLGLRSNLELALLAVSEGMADLDHIPAGATVDFNERDKQLLIDRYSTHADLEPSEQAKHTSHSRLSRMGDKLGLRPKQNRKLLIILHAIKDGIIDVPHIPVQTQD